MQVPEVEPRIIFDEGVSSEYHQLVEAMEPHIPDDFAAISHLYSYDSFGEFVNKLQHSSVEDFKPEHRGLVPLMQAMQKIFEADADVSFGYDRETEQFAARLHDREKRPGAYRMTRLRTYIGRKATWKSVHPITIVEDAA